jgi:PAS domain S-box-containing protein
MGTKRTRPRRRRRLMPTVTGTSRSRAVGDDGHHDLDPARFPRPSGDVSELVFRTTHDGRYSYVSPNVRAILGYEPKELLAQPPLASVHPDDLARLGITGDRFAAGSRGETVLLRKRHRDGHYVWLEVRVTPVRDAATGEVLELDATARDVSTRVATERALRQRISAEALIAEVSRELLTVSADEVDAVIVRSLERAARFVGADRATIVVLSADEQWAVLTHQWASEPEFERTEPKTSTAGMRWLVEQCKSGEVLFARSLDNLPPEANAERRTFEAAGVRSFACLPLTTDEQLTGGLAFSWRSREAGDVAAALSALEVLVDVLVVALDRKRAEAALRESEERFRALVQHTSDVITMMDADGILTYASPAIESMFGAKPKWVIGTRTFDYIHPDDRDRIEKVFAEGIKRPGRAETVRYRMRNATVRGGTSSPSGTTCSPILQCVPS